MLQTANEEAGKHGLLIPLDLGAKGSCNLGGYMNLYRIFSCFLSNDLFQLLADFLKCKDIEMPSLYIFFTAILSNMPIDLIKTFLLKTVKVLY